MDEIEECYDLVDANGKSNCQEVIYLCNNTLYRDLMKQQCPKTCEFCTSGCFDKVGPDGKSNCRATSYLCNHVLYSDLMKLQCPKTCNFCTSTKIPKKIHFGKIDPNDDTLDCSMHASSQQSDILLYHINMMYDNMRQSCTTFFKLNL
ncbi:Metridin ShK toxin domain containing protein [Dirofilaria immitis]|nr:Metridin ShK toxin domain containing protein [Dirofilaria immitis]